MNSRHPKTFDNVDDFKEVSRHKLIYLASPYTHKDEAVRNERCRIVSKVGAELFQQGIFTYGPIAHSENLAKHGGFGDTSWTTFRDFDLLMLSKCDELYVLEIDGWDISTGVRAEVLAAIYWSMPIRMVGSLGDVEYYDSSSDLKELFGPYDSEDYQYIQEVVSKIRR